MFMSNYKNSFHVCPTVKTNKPLIFKPLNQSKNKINIKFKTKSQNNPSPTIKSSSQFPANSIPTTHGTTHMRPVTPLLHSLNSKIHNTNKRSKLFKKKKNEGRKNTT